MMFEVVEASLAILFICTCRMDNRDLVHPLFPYYDNYYPMFAAHQFLDAPGQSILWIRTLFNVWVP